MILQEYIDLCGTEHIKSTLEWIIPITPESNVFDEIMNGGSSLFNAIILQTKNAKLRHSLLNHGICEKFQWRWQVDNVILKPRQWFNSLDTCYKNAKLHEPSIDLVRTTPPPKLQLVSYCNCMYNKKEKVIDICPCIFSWTPQLKTLIDDDEVFNLPELLKFTPNMQEDTTASNTIIHTSGIKQQIDSLSRSLENECDDKSSFDSDGITDISLYDLMKFLDHRNRKIMDEVSYIYVGKVKEILLKPPFNYGDFIASDVADGIVNYGDKVYPTSLQCDDEDDKIDEVHDIGSSYQKLHENIALKIISGVNMDVCKLFTIDERFTSEVEVKNIADTLAAVREFLKTKAQKGYTATIVMVCECEGDRLLLLSGQTVSISWLEIQIQQMLVGDDILPMVVDLLIIKDGSHHQLSQIYSNAMPIDIVYNKGNSYPIPQNIDRFVMLFSLVNTSLI